MKSLALIFGLSFASLTSHAQACNQSVDPKKIVLMVSFHDGAEEEKGARLAACERGETLVVLPRVTAEDVGNYQEELATFLASARTNGTTVSSLIISGHDGGGEYYGDYGSTSVAEISQTVSENRSVFQDTSSLLLMGCWSAPPDQVSLWRTILPNMRVLGGFVGAAPLSIRESAGTFVRDILKGERRLDENASEAGVRAMLKTVEHMNYVTAGVYVQPNVCSEQNPFYFISPANSADEMPEGMVKGLNTLADGSEREMACIKAFGRDGVAGTFDWNQITQYFYGQAGEETDPELRSLYSFLRNNKDCFSEGYSEGPILPDQALFLRFFQDTKKNFGKYFNAELGAMYSQIDSLVAATGDQELISQYSSHKKLMGDSLNTLSRRETLEEISKLTAVYDEVFARRYSQLSWGERDELVKIDLPVHNMMYAIDRHLHGLRCMHGSWHDYSEDEVLQAPSC